MEINLEELRQELNFVGQKKAIKWFNQDLTENLFFMSVIKQLIAKRELLGYKTTLRNVLYSIFPATEYLYDKTGKKSRQAFNYDHSWMGIVNVNIGIDKFTDLAAKGTQGNIPQRAAVIIDYLAKNNKLSFGQNNIIELGCAGGVLGLIFENCQTLDWEKYTWCQKEPELSEESFFNYTGYDINIPNRDYLPFFIWDEDKRKKLIDINRDFKLNGNIILQNIETFLQGEIKAEAPTFIITSYVMYQLPNAVDIYNEIMKKVANTDNLHWLDLSRNDDSLDFLFGKNFFKRGINYLSHDGVPKIQAINGSDDWVNWQEVEIK
jgi:hypothetical protein